MKRLIYSSFIMVGLLVSLGCSTTKNGVSTVGRGKITGTWTVTNISYDGLLENSIQTAFDQAPPKDFQGSTWQLTNSGNGLYTLANGTSQSIYWSLYQPSGAQPMFQFKKVYQGDKAKDVKEGYRLEIGNADGNSMTLKTPVPYGGKTGYIVYTFAKK